MEKQEYKNLGKQISLILRHKPETIGITLDKQGFADVEELLQGLQKKGKHITHEILERIVAENDKKRYVFNKEHTKIRAVQGHSLSVDLSLNPKEPPQILYHGTAIKFLKQIEQEGIQKMTRQYVHLSKDIQTARMVGKRHGTPVVLKIDAKKMYQNGYTFYLSENGVWLCDFIPKEYFLILPA